MRAFCRRFWDAFRLTRLHAAMVCLIALMVGIGWHVDRQTLDARMPVQNQQLAYVNFIIQIVIAIVAAVVSYALAPKPPKPKPAALSEFDVPQATEGQPFCWIFGECYVPDATVAYWGGLRSKAIKAKGKK